MTCHYSRKALKCVMAEIQVKYKREKEAAKAAGREPPQPEVREDIQCHFDASYHCPHCRVQTEQYHLAILYLITG